MDDDLAALLQRHQRRDVERTDVEERRDDEAHLVVSDHQRVQTVDVVPRQVAVREHGTLGPPRRARRVHDQRDVVGVDRGGVEVWRGAGEGVGEVLPAVTP